MTDREKQLTVLRDVQYFVERIPAGVPYLFSLTDTAAEGEEATLDFSPTTVANYAACCHLLRRTPLDRKDLTRTIGVLEVTVYWPEGL